MKIKNAVGRSSEEWVGANADSPIPPRVRLRVFERYEGVCYLSKRKIRPGDEWDIEHIKALSLGGEHRESNFAPALKKPHQVKTAQDRKLKAKIDRIRKKHVGVKGKKSTFACSKDSPWRKKLNGEVVPR